jgi:hypothetical protein
MIVALLLFFNLVVGLDVICLFGTKDTGKSTLVNLLLNKTEPQRPYPWAYDVNDDNVWIDFPGLDDDEAEQNLVLHRLCSLKIIVTDKDSFAKLLRYRWSGQDVLWIINKSDQLTHFEQTIVTMLCTHRQNLMMLSFKEAGEFAVGSVKAWVEMAKEKKNGTGGEAH